MIRWVRDLLAAWRWRRSYREATDEEIERSFDAYR